METIGVSSDEKTLSKLYNKRKRRIGSYFKIKRHQLSVDKVLNIAKTITTLKIKLPISWEILYKTMILTKKHKSIEVLFDENFWKNV